MSKPRIIIIGGGAAGFFAAITCAEATREAHVQLLERAPRFLAKVRISGGGRCNVTHHCFDPRTLAASYPRGGEALLGPFSRFQPADTIQWFTDRGVPLKTEADGRMFPVTDDSRSVVDCLMQSASRAGVELLPNHEVQGVEVFNQGFNVLLQDKRRITAHRMLLAMGGCRTESAARLAVSMGHTIEPPVPSLFSFRIALPWLTECAGVSFTSVQVSVPGIGLKERGPLLITHEGLSGPAVLRLSARGARQLHEANYRTAVRVNWLPEYSAEEISARLDQLRRAQTAKLVVNTPIAPIPARLWQKLALESSISRDTRWAGISRGLQHRLTQQLTSTELPMNGKSLNKDEFVTCGGVRLNEVNFKTMESRICPGLYLSGELLDIDAVTGGFNFQAAWTTGWIAGTSMAQSLS